MSGLILLFVLTLWVVLVLRMTRWLTSGMNVGMRKKRIQFGLLLMLLITPRRRGGVDRQESQTYLAM